MSETGTRESRLELRATSGPTSVVFPLAQPGPIVIGRSSNSDLQLDDPSVSRRHAALTFRPPEGEDDPPFGEWLLGDLESSRGTWLNSVRLGTRHEYRLRSGDLIVVGPWTFAVVDLDVPTVPDTARATIIDDGDVGTFVARLDPPGSSAPMPQPELQQLLDCSERIHEARNEDEVFRAVLDTVVAGTDFTRVAFLRPPACDSTEILAATGYAESELAAPTFSRTLIREAAGGVPARLQRGTMKSSGGPVDDTIVALCLPVMAGATLVGFLYLDKPSSQPRRKWTAGRAAALPAGLARLAGMGLANCMRIDIERRQAQMQAEVKFASGVQRWLLPKRSERLGRWRCTGETRQGKYIRGDFFDLVLRADGRLAVVVGDVLGRGIPVSVLVSATQGFLHARLQECANPAEAVTALHHFYRSRIEHSRFAKLWVGFLDAEAARLEYATAGQNHALIRSASGAADDLSDDRSPLAGTKHETPYAVYSRSFSSEDELLVLTDGLINQRAIESGDDGSVGSDPSSDANRAFGMESVIRCLSSRDRRSDALLSLFDALLAHASRDLLDDDATAVLIRHEYAC